MQYQVTGSVMQTVAVDLMPGETVFSQTNCMCWMNDAIEMNTHTGGGFFAGLTRSFGGGSFFITDFTANGPGHVAFAPRFPGTIMPVALAPGQSLICRKETFLVAEKSVTLEIAWQKRLGAGFFGGEGFILQKVIAPGERPLVHAGHVGVMETSIQAASSAACSAVPTTATTPDRGLNPAPAPFGRRTERIDAGIQPLILRDPPPRCRFGGKPDRGLRQRPDPDNFDGKAAVFARNDLIGGVWHDSVCHVGGIHARRV
jgi:hypothetical protein